LHLNTADKAAGFARRVSLMLDLENDPIEVGMARTAGRTSIGSGGGGNRTRVREPLRKSLYKLRLPLEFARRPVCSRPTAGLAILLCRASGDWLSLGAEPVF
jgi:hypothetical protein